MAVSTSRKLALLAAIAAPTAALAQDREQHVYVTGAMADPEQHVFVTGAMTDPEQHVFVTGAMADPEQHVFVTGAAGKPTAAPAAEDPADRAIPELPIVYDDQAATPAPATGGDPGNGKAPAPK